MFLIKIVLYTYSDLETSVSYKFFNHKIIYSILNFLRSIRTAFSKSTSNSSTSGFKSFRSLVAVSS